MKEQLGYNVQLFDSTHGKYAQIPIISKMVTHGDVTVYGELNPFSEDAFNYRDAMDVENHISGIEIVKRYIPKDGKMLYLASSYGLAPALLKEEGYDVVSLDRDRNALRFASTYIGNQVRADARKLPFIEGSFSAVISRDFLAIDYHLLSADDQEVVVDEIYRVIKKGGKAVFYTLYNAEIEREDGKPISEGLPDLQLLLQRFDHLQEFSISFGDRAEKRTMVYLVTK